MASPIVQVIAHCQLGERGSVLDVSLDSFRLGNPAQEFLALGAVLAGVMRTARGVTDYRGVLMSAFSKEHILFHRTGPPNRNARVCEGKPCSDKPHERSDLESRLVGLRMKELDLPDRIFLCKIFFGLFFS